MISLRIHMYTVREMERAHTNTHARIECILDVTINFESCCHARYGIQRTLVDVVFCITN